MRLITLLIFVFVVGCTSTEPLADQTFTKGRLSEQLEVGNRIIVITNNGKKYEYFKVVSLEEDHLEIRHRHHGHITIPYSSIQTISKEHPKPGKTAGGFLAVGLGLLAVLFIWGIIEYG